MAHGGTLKVESSSPEGTVFRVKLSRTFVQPGNKLRA
jgi:signal transduction histidine kinase